MKLSVIIPVYNQEDLVIRAILSCPKDSEIIVVDDGSTDATFKRVQEFSLTSNLKIILIKNGYNIGVGLTVNVGLDVAQGEYIVLLGSDDYFLTDNLLKVIDQANGQDMVYFNLIDNHGFTYDLTPQTKDLYCGSTKLTRREFIGETRNPDVRAEEDRFFYNDLQAKNPTEIFTGITAKHYNSPREGSLSHQVREGIIPSQFR